MVNRGSVWPRKGGVGVQHIDAGARSPELIAFDNVVLCPHIGSGTHHTRGRMAALGVENRVSWFAGGEPITPVAETPWPRPA